MAITFRSVLAGGGGGGGVSLIITIDSAFAGKAITITDGSTTFTENCPSESPYSIEIQGITAGNWTISGTIDGVTFTSSVTVSDFTTNLVSFPQTTNVSYNTAYNNANTYVSNGSLRYVGTYLDVLSGADSYHSSSTDIMSLAWNNMTKDANDSRPLNLFNDKITLTRRSGYKQNMTFNTPCYVVYSYQSGDINSMGNMSSQGNVFNNIIYRIGDVLEISTHYSTESSFISIYEII